jgi:hypothetical protein
MQQKITNKLFYNKYQHKIVLVLAGASIFRHSKMETVLEFLSANQESLRRKPTSNHSYKYHGRFKEIENQHDLDYAFAVHNVLSNHGDFEIRVESPWVSIYTNSKETIDELIAIDQAQVKYISVPNKDLAKDTILLPKINFDYRITIGKTERENSAFLEWAETNKKVKVTKSCAKELGKSSSWGGTYFYISGDNNLLMAKMHLGGSISRVERIVKA